MRVLLFILWIVSTAWAEQLSIVRLPAYLNFQIRDQHSTLSGHDFSGLVKGIAGILPSGEAPTNVDVTMSSGLKTPKLFVFLHLTCDMLPLSQISSEFPTLAIQKSDSIDLKRLYGDIEHFFGQNANLLEFGSNTRGDDPAFDPEEIVELITASKSFSQNGPIFLSAYSMSTTTGIAQVLHTFSDNLVSQFGDDFAVFAFITPAESNERVKRAAASSDTQNIQALNVPPTSKDLNVGKDYSEIYPVIFNIILWFMIAMGITIASVAYCIWLMDPGKDGIIYRMTASRIKKDL